MDFNNILIGSEDPERLVGYYTNLFGEPLFSGGGYTVWSIGSGSITVGPHSEVHGKNQHPGRLIWNISTPNVAQEFERMKAAGATVIQEPYSYEGEDGSIATFADPDDNYFQLMTPMDPDAMNEAVAEG